MNYAATVIECPPLKVCSIIYYTKDAYGLHVSRRELASSLDKILQRKISFQKKESKKEDSLHFDELRLLVHTQPSKTGIGKKKPELFEIPVRGKDALIFAKEQLGKEIKVSDVFKAGDIIDTHSVTKGKGFQGAVKRFGVFLREHKSEKKRRAVVLAPQTPRKILWGQLLPGQLGTHLRTDYNKEVLLLDHQAEKINPLGGFVRYGLVKNDYLLLKGSIPGPKKRLITLTRSIRNSKAKNPLAIEYIHTRPQQ